jgi:hypothetical protein
MLRNCPLEYYNNCANAGVKCRWCSAGNGPTSGQLFYIAVQPNPTEHPCKPSEAKKKILKRAKATEKNVEREIIRGTLRSGAALGDGDHLLLGEIRQEVKDRGPRSSWNLTWPEYTKGCRQGIQAYAISILPPEGPRKTMYIMEENVFTALLAGIQALKNERPERLPKEEVQRNS